MEPIKSLGGGATCCALGPPDRLAIGTAHGSVQIFDTVTQLRIVNLYDDEENRPILAVGFVDYYLWVHVRNTCILVYRLNNERRYDLISRHEVEHVGFCRSIAFDQTRILYAEGDGPSICMSILLDQGAVEEYSRMVEKDTPMCMATSVEGRLIVGFENGNVSVSRLENRKEADTITLGNTSVFCVATSSKNFAFGLAKPPIKMFPVDDLQSPILIEYPPWSEGCSSMAFSPNGKQLLAGFWDGSMRVFSVAKQSILLHLKFHTATVTQVLWSDVTGEERVVASSNDGRVSVWDFRKK
ncbi:unnamed protein product [Caenorhabditis auriculariae]|uniref:Anaphase-promoting complex subunit 4-like WD40 domain-containing protein n=1 Tax=Caenorhabditis auriculariae TaxID=2777116 RepID=A0A8S1HK85_9PELO|nr:unnamed protein product [Caenorhabditis auriculariae]